MTLKEFYDMLDFPSAIASFYFGREMYGSDMTIEELIEKIKTVTADDIRSLAQQISPDTVFFLKGTASDGEEDESYE